MSLKHPSGEIYLPVEMSDIKWHFDDVKHSTLL